MEYENMTLAGIALRGVTALPDNRLEVDLSRMRSIQAAQFAMTEDHKIFLIAQKDVTVADPALTDLEMTGVICEITRMVKLPNGNIRIGAKGLKRGIPIAILKTDPYLQFEIALPQEDTRNVPSMEEQVAMSDVLQDQLRHYLDLNSNSSKRDLRDLMGVRGDLNHKLNVIADNTDLNQRGKQTYLDMNSLKERFEYICGILNEEVQIAKYRQEIQNKVKENIDKNQKDYVLREQMKVIKDELGEGEEAVFDEMEAKLAELVASDEVKAAITKELKHFKNMPQMSQEALVSRNYLETVLDMPWDKSTEESTDLKATEATLEADHYGLEKVKERILDYLAVRTRLIEQGRKEDASPIICLVGPPGTGKTSIASSIARALNKKYVRICLGGVRDEAEIRGHRRTYVGAMPGRIAAGIRQAGTRNPVMLLDEIDKLGNDYKGDPSSALLEVLDPEQNCKFRDHYLEIPMDLSSVLFIATANDASKIPGPLMDRMEVIEISGYTENEKFHIARNYLVKKQMEKNGLLPDQLTVEDSAIYGMIDNYTREAGVRNLERTIGRICRKAVRSIDEGSQETVTVANEGLEKYLGKRRFHKEKCADSPEVGITRGLAWTSVGGTTLEVEVNIMPGKGALVLTGQLGDVMKESAQIALSYVKSVVTVEDSAKYFAEHDIHVHVPEGAVPKDGPSAGVTMSTSLYSAIMNAPVRSDIAMTGEVTLRGRVMPIGGLKEKLLAAGKCGVSTVCVPEDNRPDVEELSAEITEGLDIVFVSNMKQVLDTALA